VLSLCRNSAAVQESCADSEFNMAQCGIDIPAPSGLLITLLDATSYAALTTQPRIVYAPAGEVQIHILAMTEAPQTNLAMGALDF